MNQTNTAGFDLDKPPETTDEARAYLDAWHRQNLPHAPFFSAYIKTELAGDFAYHMARWLARRAEPSVTAGDERRCSRRMQSANTFRLMASRSRGASSTATT